MMLLRRRPYPPEEIRQADFIRDIEEAEKTSTMVSAKDSM
jgi:hypothetical protein